MLCRPTCHGHTGIEFNGNAPKSKDIHLVIVIGISEQLLRGSVPSGGHIVRILNWMVYRLKIFGEAEIRNLNLDFLCVLRRRVKNVFRFQIPMKNPIAMYVLQAQ